MQHLTQSTPAAPHHYTHLGTVKNGVESMRYGQHCAVTEACANGALNEGVSFTID